MGTRKSDTKIVGLQTHWRTYGIVTLSQTVSSLNVQQERWLPITIYLIYIWFHVYKSGFPDVRRPLERDQADQKIDGSETLKHTDVHTGLSSFWNLDFLSNVFDGMVVYYHCIFNLQQKLCDETWLNSIRTSLDMISDTKIDESKHTGAHGKNENITDEVISPIQRRITLQRFPQCITSP